MLCEDTPSHLGLSVLGSVSCFNISTRSADLERTRCYALAVCSELPVRTIILTNMRFYAGIDIRMTIAQRIMNSTLEYTGLGDRIRLPLLQHRSNPVHADTLFAESATLRGAHWMASSERLRMETDNARHLSFTKDTLSAMGELRGKLASERALDRSTTRPDSLRNVKAKGQTGKPRTSSERILNYTQILITRYHALIKSCFDEQLEFVLPFAIHTATWISNIKPIEYR